MILVAVRDAPRRETIRAALAHEGWLVSVVGSLDSAFRMAADHAPRLVVLDSGLPGSDDLVDVFARANGGPGILLVGEPSERLRRQADAVVAKDVEQGALVGAVKRCLDAPRPAGRRQREDGSRRWTSEELFGEILEDLDAAVAAVEAQNEAELEELEEAVVRRLSPLESATVAADGLGGAPAEPRESNAPTGEPGPSAPLVGAAEPEPEVAAPSAIEHEQAGAEAAPPSEGQEPEPEEEGEGADVVSAAWAALEVEPAPEEAQPPSSEAEGDETAIGDARAASVEEPEGGEPPETAVEAPPGPVTRPLSLQDIARSLESEVDEIEETPPRQAAEEPSPVEEEAVADAAGEDEAAQEPVFELAVAEQGPSPSSPALDALADALLGTGAAAPEVAEVEEAEPEWPSEVGVSAPSAPARAEPEPPEPLPAGARGEELGEPVELEGELESLGIEAPVEEGASPEALEGPLGEEEPEPQPEPEPERRVGAYRLLERIAESTTYELWRAERDEDASPLAVRLVREDAAADERLVERFLASGLAAGALDHPGIAPMVEAGWVDGQLIGVRHWVEGVSLAEVLSGMRELGVRMPLGLALAVGERIAAALAAAAAAEPAAGRPDGTVHGALHPGNVLLSNEGDVLLADFGLARALAEDEGEVAAGLLRYRSPEQIAGDEPDLRSDLFSFGTVLYQLVTGRPAFPGRDAGSVASAILNEAPEEPERVDPTVPAEVGGLISRLLKRRRDERLQGAGEAQRKLDLALQSLPSPPGRRELAAYLRQLRDAVDLVRSVGEDGDPAAGATEGALEEEPPSGGGPSDREAKLVAVGEEDTEPDSRRLRLAIVVLLLLALGATLAYWWGRRSEAPAEPAGTPVLVPEPPPRPRAPADGPIGQEAPEAGEGLEAPPPPPVTGTPAAAAGADVEALVAEEFARRQREMEQLLSSEEAAAGAETAPEQETDEPPDDGPPR